MIGFNFLLKCPCFTVLTMNFIGKLWFPLKIYQPQSRHLLTARCPAAPGKAFEGHATTVKATLFEKWH